MRRIIISFVVFFTLTYLAQTQTISYLETYNGNKISGVINWPDFAIQTKHGKDGKLEPALAEILQLNMGIHCPKDAQLKIDKAFKNLGSVAHENRILAQKDLLDLYRFSYFLLKNHKSSDLETSRRVNDIVEIIEKEKDLKYLPAKAYDVLYMDDGSIIHGTITNPEFTIDTELGVLKIHLSQIRLIKNITTMNLELKLDSAENQKKWVNTGWFIRGKFTVEVSGQIDLWAQGPGQYLCGPSGKKESFREGFNIGAVVGKFGENGTPFLIGEKYVGDNNNLIDRVDNSCLYLQVWDTNWNGPPIGAFTVRLRQ